MIPKKTNPPMPEQELTRIDRGRLVEGEDFTVICPDWCEKVQEGAIPTEEGWYLVVSHFWGTEERAAVLDVVYLTYNKGTQKWAVLEICSDKEAKAKDFWWVGKIKMPEVIDLRKCLNLEKEFLEPVVSESVHSESVEG